MDDERERPVSEVSAVRPGGAGPDTGEAIPMPPPDGAAAVSEPSVGASATERRATGAWSTESPATAPRWPERDRTEPFVTRPAPGDAAVPPPPSGVGIGGGWTPVPAAAPRSRRRPPQWVVVAVVAAVVGGAVGAAVAEAVGTGPTGSATISIGGATPGPALAGGASIPAIVQKVLPQVVSIDAKAPSGGGLFGGGLVEDQGTGMIISTEGEVLTNNHVISGATQITVTLYGQTSALPATLVGADPSNDVALLRLQSPPSGLQAVTFGPSKQLQVGDAVIAVGNALGLSAGTPTVTSGIVSALGRTVQAGDTGNGPTENLTNMIQTDAAINSGNSGGPLVDSAGQVVGMNTAVASSTGNNAPAENIGFAIPSATIEGLLSSLRAGGTQAAPRTYLGVEVADETTALQQQYGVVPSTGAFVVSVVAGSPAASAGIQPADVIVAFDGKAVSSAQDLTSDVRKSSPGHQARVTLYRGQERTTVTVTLGSSPAA
jgi:putative serine protease PepD